MADISLFIALLLLQDYCSYCNYLTSYTRHGKLLPYSFTCIPSIPCPVALEAQPTRSRFCNHPSKPLPRLWVPCMYTQGNALHVHAHNEYLTSFQFHGNKDCMKPCSGFSPALHGGSLHSCKQWLKLLSHACCLICEPRCCCCGSGQDRQFDCREPFAVRLTSTP